MSEQALDSGSQQIDAALYDDRVDKAANISSGVALTLLWRSLRLLSHAKGLFTAKAVLALAAVFPPLAVPWFTKIIVDQVILREPFSTTDVRFPPFMHPFVDFVAGMEPAAILVWVIIAYVVILVTFGPRGDQTGIWLTEGRDAATQSELALSAGTSKASGIFGALETLLHVRLTQRVANALRTQLFAKLTRLPMTTLEDHRTGDSVYRVMYDSPEVPGICFGLTITPLVTMVGAMMSLYFTQYSYGVVAPELVWVAVGLIPAILLVTFPLSNLARRLGQASRASGAATTNAMEESIDNISAVQSLGGTDVESAKFEKKSAHSFRRHLYVILMDGGIASLGIFGAVVGGIVVAVFAANQVFAGRMTPGDLPVLLGIFWGLGQSAGILGAIWLKIQNNVAAVRRVFFFIDYPTEDTAGQRSLPPLREKIVLEDVDVVYPDGRQALSEINLTFSARELVAIVGPTGAGKTSLAYLLPGFLQPSRGRVLFDDIDIAEINVDSLRDQVSYVFQEHTLLSKSIRDNFLLVAPLATDAEMEDACRIAGATEFISELPDGLDTVLGRAGNTLSVGQQQRLSIARGLIRNTPVLILDEPTAALDPNTENELVKSLLIAAQDRLVIVIAHRLSTIRQADRIVFLRDGRVLDTGNHEQLMADADSSYRKFVELQHGN